MLDRLFPSQLGYLERSLDRASQRQTLLQTNLANANVPNYKRRDMDFDIALNDQMGGHSALGGVPGGPDGGIVTNENNVRVDGSSIDPEQETLGIAETELRYQTLTDLTSGWFSNMKNVIREGK